MAFIIVAMLINLVLTQIDYGQTNWPALCSSGIDQSPINLPNWKIAINESILNITDIKYEQISNIKFTTDGNFFYLSNFISQNYIIVKKGTISYKYDLSTIVIKTPSEHTLDGANADLEIQLQHVKDKNYFASIIGYSNDPDKMRDYLYVSVFLGIKNNSTGSVLTGLKSISDSMSFNFKPMFDSAGYYFYEGSITQPNCDESVNWIIFNKFFPISNTEFKIIKDWISVTYSEGNSRSTNNYNGRKIYYVPSIDEIKLGSRYLNSFGMILLVILFFI